MPMWLLNKGGADAARYVVKQETLASEYAFQRYTKHEQREHVEEEVGDALR